MGDEDIINKLKFILGSDIKIKIDKQRIRILINLRLRLLSDTTVLKSHTKYKPEYNFDQGLNKQSNGSLKRNSETI